MLKFDRILTCALRAFPHSWRSFPHAMKNTLGEALGARHHLVATGGAQTESPVYRASSLSCRVQLFLRRAGAGRGHPHSRRGGRMGRADGRARNAQAGPDGDHPAAGNPLSAFSGHALFGLHGLSRLCGDAGNCVQVMNLSTSVRLTSGYRSPILPLVAQRYSPRPGNNAMLPGGGGYFRKNSSICSGRPPADHVRRSGLETPEGQRFADCAASVQLVLEEHVVETAGRYRDELRPLPEAWRSTVSPIHICEIRFRRTDFVLHAPETQPTPSARRCTNPRYARQSGPGISDRAGVLASKLEALRKLAQEDAATVQRT